MGFDLRIQYVYCYYENGKYNVDFKGKMMLEEERFFLNYLYEMNRMALEVCNAENYERVLSGNNVHFCCFQNYALLFKTIGVCNQDGIYNELEGIVIEEEQIRTAWLYMEVLIRFLYSEKFYELQEHEIITEEMMEEIEQNIPPKIKEDLNFKEVFSVILQNKEPFSFSLASIPLGLKNIKFMENILGQQQLKGEDFCLSKIFQYNSLGEISVNKTGWNITREKTSIDKAMGGKEFFKRRNLRSKKQVWYAIKKDEESGEKRKKELFCIEEAAFPFSEIKVLLDGCCEGLK